jgi:hypothetical protein
LSLSPSRSRICLPQNFVLSLILYENNYDVVVAFISSKIPATISLCDIPVLQQHSGFPESGLKVDSVIKPDKVATVMKKFVPGELGEPDSGVSGNSQ